jgi:hypothetical protein
MIKNKQLMKLLGIIGIMFIQFTWLMKFGFQLPVSALFMFAHTLWILRCDSIYVD